MSVVMVASLLTTSAVWGCPSCPVGITARQQVLDQDFGQNLVIAVVPFLLVGLVARWAERRDRGRFES